MLVVNISRVFLGVLSLGFVYTAFFICHSPQVALSDHDLDLTNQTPSAMAEIRAYYFGTLNLCAITFARGAHWNSTVKTRKESLLAVFALLSMFVIARCYSYRIDGAPQISFAFVIWAVEALGALTALLLYALEENKPKTN